MVEWISQIDLLIKQSVYAHIAKSRNVQEGTLLLTETILGWTVSGAAETDHSVTIRKHSRRYGINFFDSQSTFDRLWEIEDFPTSPET